jgi:uncharacterized protein (DUF58 family)
VIATRSYPPLSVQYPVFNIHPMLDSELLKRLDCLWLAAGQAGKASLLAGPREKERPGGGMEAAGLRDYAPGDDYRHVDWTRCARHDELLTRTFEAPEDLHLYVLLDCSPSMGLGDPSKFRLARQIAAALGYVALKSLARLSVAAFSCGIVAELPPIRHKARAPKLLRFLRQLELHRTRTDLKRTAEAFAGRYQRHGPVVIISDLYDHHGFPPGLDVLRHRGYEPRLVQIHAPREARPELFGELELFDVESETARQTTITERAARRYREFFDQFQESVRRYCAKHRLPCVQVRSDVPEDEVLLKVFGIGD